MDENINEQVETTLSSEEDNAFESGWNDDYVPPVEHTVKDTDFDDDDEDAQPESDAEPVEETDEEQEAEEPETSEETEPEQEKDEAGSQRFTLKFLGQDREVSLDEMRDLAEKGLNYDHVKEDRDSLREKTARLDTLESHETFLNELAENAGQSIEDLIETTRAHLMIQDAEKNGEDLSMDEALAKVRENAKAAKPKAEPAHEKTEEEKTQEVISRFISIYPDVKSEDIPQSVWDEASKVGDLVGPYAKYESQKLRGEIAQLKQNKKNRERSTGSRRSVGATTPKDAFDEGWDS